MVKATISAKGQISIPKAIRDRLSLKPGTQMALDTQGEQVILKRIAAGFPDWKTMRGMLQPAGDLHAELARNRADELDHDDARLEDPRV